MNRIHVESTNVDSVGYDTASQTLEVEFTNSNVYQYFDVPQEIYDELISADSVGKYLSAHIKGNYRYSRL